jgi:hypothetical protein
MNFRETYNPKLEGDRVLNCMFPQTWIFFSSSFLKYEYLHIAFFFVICLLYYCCAGGTL